MADQIYKVRDPAGNIREIKGPAGATDEEVIQQAQALFSGSRVNLIPGNADAPPKPVVPNSGPIRADTIGGVEAAIAAGTGMLGGIAGQVAGIGRTLTSGKYGTPEGIRMGEETARNVSQAMTYVPRTDSGREILGGLGEVLDASKLAGLPPSQALTAAALTAPSARQASSAAPVVREAFRREQPGMVGVGAAETAIDRLRYERAQSLPVPLPLTKGMLSRDFELQRFEKETAKDGKLGKPLRERHAELNEGILRNFDAFVDEIGPEAGGLRAVGQVVNDAVVTKSKRAKDIINKAYDEARKSGETREPVDVTPLLKYAESHQAEAINAPIISSLEAKLSQVANGGVATLNDLEEVRKMVGALSGKDAVNAHFGREIKTVIDGLTENAGGDAYKRARSLRLKYAKEFEDVGVVDKLLRTKPGTSDRAVAYEDVFKHSVLSGSLDDVRAMRRTLQTAGPDGQQAWKELQAQTVQHIKEIAASGSAMDERGNTVVSAAKLSKVVTELDKDGKLDFIFGKAGGQRLRDLADASRDILTFPPGSVNTSTTASVLLDAVGSAAVGRMPTAAAQAIQAINRARRASAIQKRVRESLASPLNDG